jgi:uncharacterized protein
VPSVELPTDPITVLLHKAQKYLRSAAVLLELEDYDSAVSRAYFAMLYAAQALMKRHGVRLGSGQGLRSVFIERYVQTGTLPARAGVALEDGYKLMELADFAHAYAIDAAQAEHALAEAEAFVNSVSPLAALPA